MAQNQAVPPAPTLPSEAAPGGASAASTSAPLTRDIWWLPRLAFLLFVAAVIGLLVYLEKTDRDAQRAILISDMLWLEQNLQFTLNHDAELLGRLEPERLGEAGVFEAHARTLIHANTGIVQVLWLDDAGQVRQAHPPLGDGRRTLVADAASARELARSLARPTYAPPHAGPDQQWHFAVHVPIFRAGQHAGTAVGIYSLTRLIEEATPWWLAERYHIAILDADGRLLAARSKLGDALSGSEYQIPLDPPGHGITLQAIPYQTPPPLAGRLIAAALVLLAVLVLVSLWALRRDMQRRLAAEAALQSEVAFRKAMEDSVQTGLRARTLDGTITYVNPAFCRMVGWPAEELIGRRPPMPYWADEYLDETRTMHARVLAGQAPAEGFEIKFKRKNGEIFDALIHEAPLIDAQGRHTGWMGSVVDITERKRAAELARQQEERLQASARLITMGEMASTLAHELNQPLSAIAGYATGCRNLIAAGHTDCHEFDRALAICQERAQRAGRIIRRIYEFVRRHEPKSELCPLDELITDLIALLEAEARRQQVRIVTELPAALPTLEADRVLLGQALLNLMKNGIEAMRQTPPAHRELTVGAAHKDEQVHLWVADRGSGISAEDAASLFEPFYTTKPEGLGVGLNICRSVVEAHRGRLWFEARPGGGSVFHIDLPITQR
ncbi:MAG: PAS domain S-box protein [Rhodocyclaceae bacterium]|nr:PAS domain S-box protein [Rhodocyclaceae bacterium]